MLVSEDDYLSVPSLTLDDIRECDRVVEELVLDRQRSRYFARSRAFNQTDQIWVIKDSKF
jgi:hypothetical protein